MGGHWTTSDFSRPERKAERRELFSRKKSTHTPPDIKQNANYCPPPLKHQKARRTVAGGQRKVKLVVVWGLGLVAPPAAATKTTSADYLPPF